jgi:hypothetical protein
MHNRLVFAVAFVVLTLGLTPTLVNVPLALADHDPRSDTACENMVHLEGKQDARTEPDSTLPDSDTGSRQAWEGSDKALGDCNHS